MGSGQSTRKLTITNEDEVGVIKVSEAIVQRLAQGHNQTTPNVSKTSGETPKPLKTPKSIPPLPQHHNDMSVGSPVYYYPELTLSALEIQQQKEKELLAQEQYWQQRLTNLELSHEKINNILEQEFKKAMDEIPIDPKGGIRIQGMSQPCSENSGEVLKCYQENSRETLKCSSLVKEFSNCVDQQRANIIAARC